MEEDMDIYTKPGEGVYFTGANGTEYQLAKALKELTIGKPYIVESIDVQNWCSYVTLKGIPGEWNTVMFKNMDN